MKFTIYKKQKKSKKHKKQKYKHLKTHIIKHNNYYISHSILSFLINNNIKK